MANVPVPASGATPGPHKPIHPKGLYKAFAASLTGTALEWYDFAVYSAAAAVVFPVVFFPTSDPLTGTILAFSTYAVGYVSRPVGGIIFGRLGDRIGRKKVLVTTLMIIGVATVLIGVLPGYASIGITAPIILVLLRFAQGVGVGGEWGGAVLLSSEYGDPHRRGFWASAAQVGPPAGNLMANGALAVLTLALTEEQFLSFGWRIAFLVSALLVAFGLWIRLRLEDTPVFKAIQAHGEQPHAPIHEVFRKELRPLIAAILCRVGPDVLYALFTVFTLTYGIQVLGYERNQVLTAVLVGSAFQLFMIPLAGAVSDRFNRRLVYGVGAVVGAVWTFIFFGILGGNNEPMLDHRHRPGPHGALLHVRPPGRLHRGAVLPPAPLHRQLAGLHVRRRDRRRHRPADVHAAAVPVRHLDPGGHLRCRGRGRHRQWDWPSAGTTTPWRTRTTACCWKEPAWQPSRPAPSIPSDRRLGAEQDVPGYSQVMVDGLLRLHGVAGHQGIEDVLVFGAHLPAPAAGAEQGGDAHQDLPDVELAVGAGDELVAGSVDQLLVEEGVQPDELLRSLRIHLLGKLGLLVQGVLHGLRRHPAVFDHQAGGMAFQHTPQLHQLRHFTACHRRNIGSALRDQFHQAVGDKQQERLPDRGARDADLGGQLLLVEELPLHLRVDQDVFPQVRVRLLAAGRRRPRTFSHTLCIQQTGVISCV